MTPSRTTVRSRIAPLSLALVHHEVPARSLYARRPECQDVDVPQSARTVAQLARCGLTSAVKAESMRKLAFRIGREPPISHQQSNPFALPLKGHA